MASSSLLSGPQPSEDILMTQAQTDTGLGQEGEDRPSPVEENQVQVEQDFDWEPLVGAYRGRTRIERLLFLAQHAPALRIPCSAATLSLITSSSKDVQQYQRALLIRNTEARPDTPLLPKERRVVADTEWCERTEKSNRMELEKLDLELRNYQNNLIKESIRMGYRDLGDHLRATGNLSEALKHYIKTRDYCSTNEHLVEMCLNVIEVSLDLQEYAAVSGYVNKAEALLDTYNPHAAAAAKASSSGMPANKGGSTSGADAIGALFRAGGSAGSSNPASLSSVTGQIQPASELMAAQRDAETQGKRHVREIKAKLHVAQGIAYLGLRRYRQAAQTFLDVAADTGDAYATMASRSDVASYIVLCALATLDRKELKSLVIDRAGISALLEHDTEAQQLLESFYACEYRRALSLLDKAKTRSLLNMTLAPHFTTLSRFITQRALRQFVQPFDTLQIARLAASLGWQGVEGEAHIIEELLLLIQKGDLDARVDVQNNILYTKKVELRDALFQDAIEAGKRQTVAAKRLMLRVSLLQNGLVAKASHDRTDN